MVLGRELIIRDCSAIAGWRKRCVQIAPEISGDLPPPSPPAEKATARQDQAGKSVGQLAIAVAKAKRADHESQHARCNNLAGNLGDELTTATCQGEKTAASRYKTRQSRTHNRPRHCLGRN